VAPEEKKDGVPFSVSDFIQAYGNYRKIVKAINTRNFLPYNNHGFLSEQ
jgi:hypothetical protein